MRFYLLVPLFIFSLALQAQRVEIPLFSISYGNGDKPEVKIGPFDIDLPIGGAHIESEWALASVDVPYLRMNKLQYANRAACALKGSEPTKSFTVIIDTMNVARAIYRLGIATSRDPKELTRHGVRRFRYSVMKMIELITSKIMTGRLPLLPHQNDEKLSGYSRVISECRLDEYCEPLDDYIGELWGAGFLGWRYLDNFKRKNILSEKHSFQCYRQKKFSPLAQDYSQKKPTKESLEEIAKAHINHHQYLDDCDEMYRVDVLESSAFQGEILEIDNRRWNQIGFDYWHSLKIYLSWAWRNARELDELGYPFSSIFRSVHFEDSVMIFSNGCQSITEPKCDTAFLNQQTIRDFSKKGYEKEVTTFDHLRFLSDGAAQKLVDIPEPDFENILGYNQFQTINDWVKNFRINFTRSRGVMKGRLQQAATFLDLATTTIVPEPEMTNLMPELILNQIKKIHTGEKEMVSERIPSTVYDELYFLCSEYQMVDFEGLGFKEKLASLKDYGIIDSLMSSLTDAKVSHFYSYFIKVSREVNSFCENLNKSKYWEADHIVDRSGYREWMKELIYPDGYPQDEREKNSSYNSNALFIYKTGEVVCYNGIDCARDLLESMIQLYSVAQYAETYFAPFQMVNSPSLNNPYAERTACKVYDPWWKVKKGIFNLFADATTGLINGFNPTPFYIDVDLKGKKVTSLKKLWEDGTLKLEPQYDKKRLLYWAGVELGPLLGASCSVAMSNTHQVMAPQRYFFAGVTVAACGDKDENNTVISTVGHSSDGSDVRLSGCFSCTLSFEGAVRSTNIPAVESGYYIIRGLVRFFQGVFDPVDTPRSWEVDVNNVLETYRRYGEIPKKCVGRLKRGHYCLEDEIEMIASKVIQRDYGRSIRKIERQGNRMSIDMHGCRYPIFNISTRKLHDAWKRDNYVEQLQSASYCEWNR